MKTPLWIFLHPRISAEALTNLLNAYKELKDENKQLKAKAEHADKTILIKDNRGRELMVSPTQFNEIRHRMIMTAPDTSFMNNRRFLMDLGINP